MKAKCFISHAWRDGGHDFAIRLAEALLANDISTWLDEHEILPIHAIEQRMRDGVRHECDVFLFLISPASLESRMCAIELKEALKFRKETGLQIIPLLGKDCRIPQRLKGLLYVDFRDEGNFDQSFKKLLAGIEEAYLVRMLVSQLSNGDSRSRTDAAQCLGKLRNPYTVPILRRSIFNDIHPNVRQWAAFALGQIHTRAAIDVLRKAKQREKDPLALLGIQNALREEG